MLSIILPVYREPYLNKTLKSLLDNATGDIEVIPVFDGVLPDKDFMEDKRIKSVHITQNKGMRFAINIGVECASGDYIMKMDAHCCISKGYDEVLTQMEDNWLVVPRRYPLNADTWDKTLLYKVKDYHYFNYPSDAGWGRGMFGPVWEERGKERKDIMVDENMTFQGSCWVANKKFYLDLIGKLDDNPRGYGTFTGEPLELCGKYWLSGRGKVMVNKNIWYAHLFKNKNFYENHKELENLRRDKARIQEKRGHEWGAKHWINNEEPGMKHKFSWLIERFWPVPTWPDDRSLWHY